MLLKGRQIGRVDAGYAGSRWLVVLLWLEWPALTGSHTLKMENEGVIYVDEEETKPLIKQFGSQTVRTDAIPHSMPSK